MASRLLMTTRQLLLFSIVKDVLRKKIVIPLFWIQSGWNLANIKYISMEIRNQILDPISSGITRMAGLLQPLCKMWQTFAHMNLINMLGFSKATVFLVNIFCTHGWSPNTHPSQIASDLVHVEQNDKHFSKCDKLLLATVYEIFQCAEIQEQFAELLAIPARYILSNSKCLGELKIWFFRSENPRIYHLDVGAMYPNIILTNRLQVGKNNKNLKSQKSLLNYKFLWPINSASSFFFVKYYF